MKGLKDENLEKEMKDKYDKMKDQLEKERADLAKRLGLDKNKIDEDR